MNGTTFFPLYFMDVYIDELGLDCTHMLGQTEPQHFHLWDA
jgi:hypothetical protein